MRRIEQGSTPAMEGALLGAGCCSGFDWVLIVDWDLEGADTRRCDRSSESHVGELVYLLGVTLWDLLNDDAHGVCMISGLQMR